MVNRHLRVSILFSCAVVVALGISAASAQTYPSKPIRIITSGVGSGADIASRLLAQQLPATLGQPVIVDNRPSGDVEGQAVAQSPPDGYTVLYEGSALWLRPLLRNTPYDPIRDFQPITQSLRQAALLVVHPTLPVKSAKDLITLAKSRPGALNYATGSTGSLTHLAAELFQSMAGVKLTRVAYKSGSQALLDLIAGEVQVMFVVAPTVAPHMKAGRLKALGVTSAQPTELIPGVPTLSSTGLPGFEYLSNVGIFVPAKTPRAIVDRLNQEFVRALFKPEVRDKFLADGVEPVGGSPEQLEAAIKAEMAKVGKLVKERGIRDE